MVKNKMEIWQRIFKKEQLTNYLNSDKQLVRTLSAKDLIALGIGAVIGTGIFILPGTVAATKAGPAIIISFALAALVCGLAAMAYAELSSAMPIAGSAYSYGNVLYGEVIGWILGWALILEYLLAVAAVSTGWSAYFADLVSPLFKIPTVLSGAYNPTQGTYVNIVAVLIVLVISWLLSFGLSTSKRVQNVMVLVKIAIIILFIVVGLFYIKSNNLHPFIPKRVNGAFGVKGILEGTSLVFFAFLGFDAVSASAAEVKNPKKAMPRGIIGTLLIATILYMLVGFVLTGMVHYTDLNVPDPVAFALSRVGQNWASLIVTIGALAGMFTMMVTMIYSGSRLVYSIGRDGLLPKWLGTVDKTTKQPRNALIVVTIIIATLGGMVPLDKLTELVNMGTLLAFTFVSFGILIVRKRDDIENTGYRMPGFPILPVLSGAFSIFMITQLQKATLITALIWFIIGLIVYMTYGLKHSRLNQADK